MVPHAQPPHSRVQGRGSMAMETQSKGVLRLGDGKVLFLAAGMGDRQWSQAVEENVVPQHSLQGPARTGTLRGRGISWCSRVPGQLFIEQKGLKTPA